MCKGKLINMLVQKTKGDEKEINDSEINILALILLFNSNKFIIEND